MSEPAAKKKTRRAPDFRPRCVWNEFPSRSARKKILQFSEPYKAFLNVAKTEREAVVKLVDLAKERGFVDLDSPLEGKVTRFFRVFKGKALAMCVLGRDGEAPFQKGFNIIGAHVDSPRLDLKPRTLYEDSETKLAMLKTHYYGGVRKYHWWSRALSLHGVVILASGKKLTISIGDDPDQPCFCLPDLLPHLSSGHRDKRIESGFDAEKMNVLCGSLPVSGSAKGAVLKRLYKDYKITEEDITFGELCFVPSGQARDVGFDKGLVGSYGQDDKSCAFASAMALFDIGKEVGLREAVDEGEEEGETAASAPAAAAPVAVEVTDGRPLRSSIVFFFDREEIGSEGSTGAKSAFFLDFLHEVAKMALPKSPAGSIDYAALRKILFKSRCISADVTVGLNPNYKEVSERMNAAKIGFGVAISKYTGHRGKLSTNDASCEFMNEIRQILTKADVPFQLGLLGRTDVGGGGTIAKFLAAHGLDTVDIGIPVLGMHSPMEIVHKSDVYTTYLGYKAFVES